MAIGLAGAQRVGKTTLAQEFAKAHDIPLVQTSASEVFRRMGYDPKVEYPFEARLIIQEMLLGVFESQYKKARQQSPFFITDRTPIDLAAYLLADVQRSTLVNRIEAAAATENYVRRCLQMASSYFSLIVLVQPGIPVVESEGKAPGCPAFMEHMNALQMGLLCDDRTLFRKFQMPRKTIKLDDRLASLNVAVDSVLRAAGGLAKEGETLH